MAIALAAADTYVVVLALTDMMAGVGVGIEAIQRATPIISGFLLGYIATLPLIGRLADLLDRHRILQACLVIFTAGSVITALAVELPVLVGGRFLQGVGGGGLVPATLALVADLWPPARRGTPLGVVGAVQELGSVLGPVLGAAVLAIWDWRAIFWLNAVLALVLYAVLWALARGMDRPAGGGVALRGVARRGLTRRGRLARSATTALVVLGTALGVLALAAPHSLVTSVRWGAPFVPFAGSSRALTPVGVLAVVLLVGAAGSAAPRWWPVLRRADLVGAALVAVVLGSLVLTFASSDPEKEVVGPWGLRLLPVGAIAAALAWWWHRRAAVPLIPRGVVRGRALVAVGCSLLVGVALVAVVVDVPLLARLTVTESMTVAAFVLVRFLVAVPVGALLGGLLLRRLGPGLVAAPGLALAAAGMFAMARWDRSSLSHGVPTTAALVAAGLGLGLALAPVNAAALADSPMPTHGIVSSLLVVARMVGMVVGLAVLTAYGLSRYYDLARELTNPTTDQLLDAGVVQVQTVFAGGAVAVLVAAGLALGLGRTRDPDDEGTELSPRSR